LGSNWVKLGSAFIALPVRYCLGAPAAPPVPAAAFFRAASSRRRDSFCVAAAAAAAIEIQGPTLAYIAG